MITQQCEPWSPGRPLNAGCDTCGHTLGAHTVDHRCDVCAVLIALRAVLYDRAGRLRR